MIPTGWSQHHAPVAAGGMNAHVVIRDPAEATQGEWDTETGTRPYVPGPAHYDGPARIQELNDAHEATQADQDVTTRTYLIQLLFDAPHIEQGWQVTVTEAENDTDLIAWTTDRPLVIADVQHGSERFTRDIVASANLD